MFTPQKKTIFDEIFVLKIGHFHNKFEYHLRGRIFNVSTFGILSPNIEDLTERSKANRPLKIYKRPKENIRDAEMLV